MIIKIPTPQNLIFGSFISQDKIPCLLKISSDAVIEFTHPFSDIEVSINNWDLSDFTDRIAMGSGGDYVYYHSCLLTLAKAEEEYKITYLSLFDIYDGWIDIIDDGQLTVLSSE